MTTSTKTNATNSIPSFAAGAVSLSLAKRKLLKGEGSFEKSAVQAFTQFIDACVVRGMQRTEASCKAIHAEIMTAFKEDIKTDETPDGIWKRSTVSNYSQGVQRAFFHDATWSTRAFQSEKNGGLPSLPWSNKAGAPIKTGSVKETTVPALIETLRKALEQCKLLNRDSIHGALLDVCVEIDADFKE